MIVEDLQTLRKAADDVPSNANRGGDLRILFSPKSGLEDGLFGALLLAPGEIFREHYHPYSEECLYVSDGLLIVTLDGESFPLSKGSSVRVPIGVRHKLTNESTQSTSVVFSLYGIAPSPELGHVDTSSESS